MEGLAEGQWTTDGTHMMDQDEAWLQQMQGDLSMKDGFHDGQGWESLTGMDGSRQLQDDGQGWNADAGQEISAKEDREAWSGEGNNSEQGRAWRGKGRGRKKVDGEDVEGKETSGNGETQPNAGPVAYTTVMLRNIPNKYTREMLVKQLNSEFRGNFDFVYLPIDFKNRCNVGYGFINFRTVEACDEFVTKFNGVDVRKCLPGLNSRKVAEVTPARVQGLDENVRRLRNGPVMNELVNHSEWMPLLLDEDGQEMPFPLPDQPCPPVKPRRRGRDEHSSGGGRSWA